MKYLRVFTIVLCLLVLFASQVSADYRGCYSGHKGCFIATAAYGSDIDPYKVVLRKSRDERQTTNEVRRHLDPLYYQKSPPIVEFIAHPKIFRAVTRWVLAPLVYGLLYPKAAMFLLISATMGLVVLFLTGFIRKRCIR